MVLSSAGRAGSSLLCGLFCSHGEHGLLSSCGAQVCPVCCCRVQARGTLGFRSGGARGFSTQASMAPEHRLSRSTAYGILSDQGSNPFLRHGQVDSLPLSLQEKDRLHWRSPWCWERVEAGREGDDG